jgi:ribonuclease R
MSIKYQRRLIEHVRHERYSPAAPGQLASDLNVSDDDRPEFDASLARLIDEQTLVADPAGRIGLPPMPEIVTGTFKKNPRGFGFVTTHKPFRGGDVFIPPDAVADALSGDTVRVSTSTYRRNGELQTSGAVLEVIERRRANFTGVLTRRGSLWMVMPDGRELTQPVIVKDPAVKNAREGDKVAFELTTYPEGRELGEGVIVKVLGEAGLPDVETQAVILAYSLPGEFPKECIDQARAAAADFERQVRRLDAPPTAAPPSDRLDLRDQFIITIDPSDSKDFDDAISIEVSPDGWRLGVHIADVAHFIPLDSPLDLEARARANSCYLPRTVIPMLPEVLSNGICSLSEGVPRFCKSAFMTYTSGGEIVTETVAATVIRSAKRLTYLEAQALIDGDLREARKHARTEPKYPEQLIKALREMDRLAKAIRARRKRAGMIHLELPQVELVFDDAGHVIDAVPEDNAFTHTLIEMFMVEANEVLARLFAGLDLPLLRRIHPEPPPGDVTELRQTAKVAGFTIPRNPSIQELQALLDSTAGTPAARPVHFAVLRTLTKAEYSPADVGHYALASDAYAHFTSPIRRYADLTVHRALSAYLRQTDNGRNRPRNDRDRGRLGRALAELGRAHGILDEDELVEIGRHCSRQEVNAEGAESSLRNFLVLQLLTQHMGEAFPGIVTNVSNTGVFVQLEKYLIDGMIKAEDLPTGVPANGARGPVRSGRWSVDQRSGALVNAASGRSFSIGDRVNVTIASIDLALRKMDLVVTDPASREHGKARGPGGAGAGGPAAKGAPGDGVGARKRRPDAQRPAAGHDDFFHPNRLTGSKRRALRSRQRDQAKPDHRAGPAAAGPRTGPGPKPSARPGQRPGPKPSAGGKPGPAGKPGPGARPGPRAGKKNKRRR